MIPNLPYPIDYCITGSVLVDGIEHADIDYCLLFNSEADVDKFVLYFDGVLNDGYGDTRFSTCRNGKFNFICTADVGLFWRTVAFSGIVHTYQPTFRCDRVNYAKACMDWVPMNRHSLAVMFNR